MKLLNRASLFLLFLAAVGWAAEPVKVWQNTRLSGSPETPPPLGSVRAYPELAVQRPVALEWEPGTGNLLMLQNYAWSEDRTILKRFAARPEVAAAETLLELPEMAYTICFHPRYAENGYLYLGRNGPGPGAGKSSRLVRYTVSRKAPFQLVAGSAVTIIEWSSDGHNGAAAAFGRDGMLYVTSGDGTAQSDADQAGQDTASMRSKVLRIDVDAAPPGQPYVVPPDNPFLGNPLVRPETWAYGFRNPWRITSDPESGQIWVGQNGQDLREYANLLERGANYGWSEYEGSREFIPGRLKGPAPFTPPTIEHDHAAFRSLTGGFVYRGKRFPELTGAYLYGDYGTGRVWAAKHDGKQLLWNREIADTPAAIAGFGTNPEGDILIADHLGNAILKLEPAPRPDPAAQPFPKLLSDTGLFANVAELKPMEGIHPYEINAPAWHDGAKGDRLLALPGTACAEFFPAHETGAAWKSWNLPDGTVVVQTLTLPEEGTRPVRRMETRLLVKEHSDWAAYSYLWNEAQTEATLVPKEGIRVPVGGREWLVPARGDCVACHGRGANYVLSLTNAQLNRNVRREGGLKHQLEALAEAGWVQTKTGEGRFSPGLPKPVPELPRLVDPADPTAPLADRAKAWLATNCSHCHLPEGGGNSAMNLAPWASGADQHLLNAMPQHGDLGLPDARLLTPGEVGRSVLPVRVMSRGPGQMPPIGTLQIDPAGLQLLIAWLQSLPPAPGR